MILSKKLSYLVHESSNHINKSDHTLRRKFTFMYSVMMNIGLFLLQTP